MFVSKIPATPITDGLLSRWLLAGNANDSIGSRDGIWTGAEKYLYDEKLGQVVGYFNGSSCISFSPTGLPSGTASGTIMGWAKFTIAGNSGVMGYGTGDGSNARALFRYSSTSSICGYVNNSNINTGLDPNSDGSWHHLALACTGATALVYVDGVLQTSYSIAASTSTTVGEIGRCGGFYSMLGTICDCRVYSRALSASDVLSIAQFKG